MSQDRGEESDVQKGRSQMMSLERYGVNFDHIVYVLLWQGSIVKFEEAEKKHYNLGSRRRL